VAHFRHANVRCSAAATDVSSDRGRFLLMIPEDELPESDASRMSPERRAFEAHRRANALVSILLDRELRILWAAAGIEALTGFQPHTIVGRSALDFVHDDDLPQLAGAMAQEIADGAAWSRYEPTLPTMSVRCRIRSSTNRWLTCELFAFNYLHDLGVNGVLIVVRNATIDSALAAAADVLAGGSDITGVTEAIQATFNLLDRSESFVILDPVFPSIVGSGFPFANDAVSTGPWIETLLTGAPRVVQIAEMSGHEDLVAYANRRGYRAIWMYPITEPSTSRVRGCLTVLSSLSGWPRLLPQAMLERSVQLLSLSLERDQFTNRLRHAAYIDALTGVLSRIRLFSELERATTVSPVTVLYVDLDGFKQVNDVYGHSAGDTLLRAAAERIRAAVRPGDLVGRLGGDEFAIVCGERLDRSEAVDIAARVVEAFHRPVSVNEVTQSVTVSVGIAFGEQFVSPGDVVASADAAMYRAKQAGKNRWSL
jgi:diguanylate cyclase (GGDEF)-like protein